MSHTPRIRIFAGPNGSGKSCFNTMIAPRLLGVYINADEIEKKIKAGSELDFHDFNVNPDSHSFIEFLSHHPVLKKSAIAADVIARLSLRGSILHLNGVVFDSYLASAISDYIRQQLLEARVSFTFETVMSDRSKIELLAQAREKGYRVYVYYIATDDAEINVSRVEARYRGGGHGVAPTKIRERYKRSLDLLVDAIRLSDRAFIFDNSGIPGGQVWLAEITDSQELEIKSSELPDWFNGAVLEKFGIDASTLDQGR